jgi:hypothetical protein
MERKDAFLLVNPREKGVGKNARKNNQDSLRKYPLFISLDRMNGCGSL